MTIQHSMEWNEILGDMIAEREVHEAIAADQELTEKDLDDWYASLTTAELENYEDHKDKS
jgi:hypothetical protein